MNIKNELLKQAAYRVQRYKIKQADLGYSAGPFWELGQAIARNIPTPILGTGKFLGNLVYENRKPVLWTAAGLAGLYLWNRRKKSKQLEERSRINELQNNGVPNEVLSAQQTPDSVKATVDPDKALADVAAEPKTAEYRLSTVMNYMYS